MIVYGKNVFNEIKNNPTQIRKIYLSNSFNDRNTIKLIKELGIKYISSNNKELNNIALTANHQGIVAIIDDYTYGNIEDVYNDEIVVILDHIEDPHNLGAIIRTCETAGIKSIIIPKDRSTKVNATVMKTSAGALTYVNVCQVSNLTQAINKLKDNGFFIYGSDVSGTDYKKVNFADKTALVIGNEGDGMSKIVTSNCDELVSIPMKGNINSLNASVAAGILIYKVINK